MAIDDLFERVMAVVVPSCSPCSLDGGTPGTRMDKGCSPVFPLFPHKSDKSEKKPEIGRKEGDSIDTSFFANCEGTEGTGEHLTADEREIFEERAAICEFDGGLIREKAEAIAWREVAQFRAEHHAGGFPAHR
jgi:hypothetical protein